MISILFFLTKGSSFMLRNESCHAVKDVKNCMHIPDCVWCDAAAVPSACYTKAEAAGLPAAVFECKANRDSETVEMNDQ